MSMVCKSEDEHLIYGEVYAPNRPDAQGEYMTKEHIKKSAHDFIRNGRMGQIDIIHDNKVVKGCSVVESFIAPDDDKTFIPGAWVIGMHVPDQSLWDRVKKGEINGFSMEAFVTRHDRTVKIEIPPIVTGTTSKADDGHDHQFFVAYDKQGNFKGGMTDALTGHTHPILAGTHTQKADDGHTHRFSAVDNVEIQDD
jgi:hypothetical protein